MQCNQPQPSSEDLLSKLESFDSALQCLPPPVVTHSAIENVKTGLSGTYNIEWRAGAYLTGGSHSTQTQVYTVIDTENPTIVCPADVTVLSTDITTSTHHRMIHTYHKRSDYIHSFLASGCSNENAATGWWEKQTDTAAWDDMYAYCKLTKEGNADQSQIDHCCGAGIACKPTVCTKQGAWTGGKVTPTATLLRCVSGHPGWVRPYGNVATTVAGVESCRDQCTNGGFKYWGTECPMTSQVHCQCSNAASLAATGTSVSDAECNTDKHSPKHHCIGPFSAGPYGLGAANVGTVYSTKSDTTAAGKTSNGFPICPGQPAANFCDGEGDCDQQPVWCACPEAQALCAKKRRRLVAEGVPQLQGSNLNGATVPGSLEACIGECDHDVDCKAGLKCFQREHGEAIPGCSGSGGGTNWDYCYEPSATTISARFEPERRHGPGQPRGVHRRVRHDVDCKAGLKCFQREPAKRSPVAPGREEATIGTTATTLTGVIRSPHQTA